MIWRAYAIIAQATGSSSKAGDAAILGTLITLVAGLVGSAAGWLVKRWTDRRADAFKELSEIIDRLKADIKEMKGENAECIAHHEQTAVALGVANRRIAELTEEVVSLRVETAHKTERLGHAVKTVASRVIDNTVDIAVLGARSGEFPAVEVPPEAPPDNSSPH